ncbi:MlaD family protein [Alloprevotella tannerae]|jgi:virulence factor mce family protein|uniref:Virulence factor Mce family protein n=1 Tax=Alloprevotella tannerae ATCC 51259 TaxID=626522 RepID=C9LJY6_9BACT|nr:MlaD family protein [Alloprevotella tannerae]EEX70508.1 putative virulence factor Mce family protein [Alloprevotella tannerae ATCC 51259]
MKIFNREVKIALTAIVAIVLVYLLINFMKGINVFKSSNTYYVRFDNIAGLAVSNAVYANGYPVGIVRGIQYDYGNHERVVVAIELDKEMHMPRGTKAELVTSLMGGVTMSLMLGPNPTDNLAQGDTISGGLHEGAVEKVEALMPTIMDMLPKLDSIVTNVARLSADPALAQTLRNTAEITNNLRRTSAKLDAMVGRDLPQMMQHLNNTSRNVERLSNNLAAINLQETMNEVNASLAEVRQFSANINAMTNDLNSKLNSQDNTFGLLLNDRKLYDNLNRTVSSADSLLINVKAHPKRYVHFSIFGKKDK